MHKCCKRRDKGRVVEVVQRIVFGDPKEVMRLLGGDADDKINTAYIERFNLTIRNSLASFIRRGMNSSYWKSLYLNNVSSGNTD